MGGLFSGLAICWLTGELRLRAQLDRFALIKTNSKQDAVEFTKKFMNVAGDGEVEIRQVYEQPAK